MNASPAQRKKVKELPCIVCGVDRFETKIDPAHVYPQRFAHCECADGVVPLCRTHHNAYDELLGGRKFDLLPYMKGYEVELAHAIQEHGASMQHVLEVVTGTVWVPKVEHVHA